MSEKNTSKKKRKVKDKRSKKKALGGIFKIHKGKRLECLFHMWKKSNRKWYACGTFHPKIRGGNYTLLPRGKCPCAMLQLQYKSRRKSVYIWSEVRRKKGKRTVRSQAFKR